MTEVKIASGPLVAKNDADYYDAPGAKNRTTLVLQEFRLADGVQPRDLEVAFAKFQRDGRDSVLIRLDQSDADGNVRYVLAMADEIKNIRRVEVNTAITVNGEPGMVVAKDNEREDGGLAMARDVGLIGLGSSGVALGALFCTEPVTFGLGVILIPVGATEVGMGVHGLAQRDNDEKESPLMAEVRAMSEAPSRVPPASVLPPPEDTSKPRS